MVPMRTVQCDCGFEASGDGEHELMSTAQDHARSVHGVELPAELLPDLPGALGGDRYLSKSVPSD